MKAHEIKQGTIVTCPRTNKPLMEYLVTVPCRHKLRHGMVKPLVSKLRITQKRRPRQTDFIHRGVIFAVLDGDYVTQIHTRDGWVGGSPPKPDNNEVLKNETD